MTYHVIDSSAWLEYFAGSNVGKQVLPMIRKTSSLLVPSITIFEVVRKITQQVDRETALGVTSPMRQAQVVDLTTDIALLAADLSIEYELPMAESIIYATARRHHATLWTLDNDFRGLANVQLLQRK